MYKKILFYFSLLFFISTNILALGIYDSNKYAWGDQTGWYNFKADNGNINVSDSELTGNIWSDNYGWINLKPINSGVVNDGDGNLSGYAWGENLGWINFNNVYIDINGYFKGTASIENNGLINFEGTNISVRTYWTPKKEPTNIQLSNSNINENNNINDIIGDLSTTDLNSSDTHTYSLNCNVPGDDDLFFNISGNKLKASYSFDYELPEDSDTNNIYNICIRSIDNTGLFYDKNFSIKINNIDDAVNIYQDDNCLEHSLHGFAWSDNIGWISFDCKGAGSKIDYGVDIDKDGNLSGEAWSDNIGWISFDYYTGENSRPRYNKDTKKLEGYVKALSGLERFDDNFNGKISLSGVSSNGYNYSPVYNPTTGEFDEFAWGDLIGWIDFKTDFGVVSMDQFYFKFTSNKGTAEDPVSYDDSIILRWETLGAVSCTASDGSGTNWTDNPNKSVGEPNPASETILNLKSDTIFSLTCNDVAGHSITKKINVRVAPAAPILFLSVDDDNIPMNTATTIKWNVENVENCIASSSSGTWDKNLNPVDGIHEDSTGNLTDSTNWFRVKCDSKNKDYYPNGVEEIVYVNVEKLMLEFYPESNPIKFNDKIKLYWIPEFATSCVASGDLSDFNGNKDSSEGMHVYLSPKQETEGVVYNIEMFCEGRQGQTIQKDLQIRVGKNPRYQEI